MNFKNQILLLTDYFKRENFDYAIIGAFALHAYGYTRATIDVDFITRIKYQDKIVNYLESINFETINRSEAFSNHLYPAGSVRFDLLYVDGETADLIFDSLEEKTLFDELKIPVVSAEHLIALKLFAAYSDPNRKLKELADIKELTRNTAIDYDKIKKYFKKYNLEDYYNEITGKNR